MVSDSSSWVNGAAIGFASAFFIQALAGHWKLWVDHRKTLVDDLIKAIDAARSASVEYFEQQTIPAGAQHQFARDVIYTQKVVTDLFGIIDERFGPVSKTSHNSFRQFRELATGEGFLKAGNQDKQRAVEITIVAASCAAHLREWHCVQLSPIQTAWTFLVRNW